MANNLQSGSGQSPQGKWQIDSRLLDILIAVEGTDGATISKRPWLTVVISRSRYVRGIRLSIDPLDDTGLEDFIRSINKFKGDNAGHELPNVLWSDNGEAFRSYAAHHKGNGVVIRPFPDGLRRRGKIERVFRHVDEAILPVLPGRTNLNTMLTLEELSTMLNEFVRQYNARRIPQRVTRMKK